MKFLLDENVSQTTARTLREAGFSVIHVINVGFDQSPDEKILAFARRKKYIVITHDKDFGNLIRLYTQKHQGVILLRFRNQKPNNVSVHLLRFLKTQKNLSSKLVVLREDGARVISGDPNK